MAAITNSKGATMTTDFSILRADCRDKGWPTDHPYWTATSSAPVSPQPLAIRLTPEQAAYMKDYAPVARAQSDANIQAGI